MNRREMIKMTGAAAVGATVLGLPVGASASNRVMATPWRPLVG